MNDQTSAEKGGFCSPCHSEILSYIWPTPCIIAGVAIAVKEMVLVKRLAVLILDVVPVKPGLLSVAGHWPLLLAVRWRRRCPRAVIDGPVTLMQKIRIAAASVSSGVAYNVTPDHANDDHCCDQQIRDDHSFGHEFPIRR